MVELLLSRLNLIADYEAKFQMMYMKLQKEMKTNSYRFYPEKNGVAIPPEKSSVYKYNFRD